MSRTLASQFRGHGAGWAAPTGRLVPDPEWPVPPRGWQLWAAAVPSEGSASPSDETRPFVAADDAAFTMPTRLVRAEPGELGGPRESDEPDGPGKPVTVDLLAEERGRRLPPGSVLDLALVAAFVALGVAVGGLVGGVVGGVVVLGVSVLLTAAVVLVRGGAARSASQAPAAAHQP